MRVGDLDWREPGRFVKAQDDSAASRQVRER
jgi:hypothetical protein